jgi:hypothetical protein
MKVFFIFTSNCFLLDPSKQVVFKMAYIRKTTYNIGGSIIPSTLSCHQKEGVHNLIEHPGNTPILHRAQAAEVPHFIRGPLIFSLSNSVQDSSYAHT